MFRTSLIGNAKRFSVTGATLISTVGNVAIIGVMAGMSVADNAKLQIFAGNTANATSTTNAAGTAVSGIIIFTTGLGVGAHFLAVPAYCSSGAAVNVINAGVTDITIFWNPIST